MCSRPRRLAACGGGDSVEAPNICRRTRTRKTGAGGISAVTSSSFRLTARSAALQILAVAATSTRQSSGADSQKPGSSIGPVVTMLEGMRQQNEKEARIAREEQDALEHECEQTKIQEEKELAVLRTSLTSETAKREESSALVVKSSDAIAAASEKQQALGKNLAAEKKIFAEEKAEFAKLDKESAQTIDMVRRAIRALTLKKSKGGQEDGAGGAALLQRALDGVQTAVSAITKASFVSTGGGASSSREKLRALLVQQPQAVDQGLDTESGMGGVIDMFEKFLQDEIANRSQRQQEWSENQMKKQLLVQQISNNVANTVTFLEREKSKKAQAEENQAKAAGAMATLNEEIGKCQKTLSDSQTKCRIATKEFEEEQADFAAELKALTAAMDILQKAPDFLQQETASGGALPLPAGTSFVQMSSRTTSRMKKVRSGSGAGVEEEVEVDEDDAGTMNGSTPSLQDIKSETSASLAVQKLQRQTRASIYLQKLAGPHKNLLYQLSIKVAEDPFEKVKSMIANMVAKLEKEMAEAASKEQYCQTETAKGSKDLKQKTLEKEKLTMRKEKAMADKTKLEKTIAQLENRIQEINADKETMTSTRAKNKKQNEEEMEVALKNEEACGKAIQVLQEYFATSGGASFLQTEASTGVQNVGDSVIALLETAEADFAKTKIDLQNLEQSLQTQYDDKMQDYREELAGTKATIKGYEGEVATLNTQIADAETDEANAGKEEAASAQYLDKIKEECETKAPSFEERQKRREEEIEGLKNAIEILEGETAGAA